MNWERWGRAAGAVFVVLTIAAFITGGEPPTVGDPVEDVVSYFDGDRGQVLVSSYLFVVALGFFLWFGATLANNFRERGEGRVGATMLGAVTAFTTLQLALTGLNAVLAYSVAGDGEPSLALIDWQLTFRWRPGGRGGASFDDVAAEGEPIDDCGAEPGSVNGLIHQENDSFESIATQMG